MSNYDLNLFQDYQKANQLLEAASFNCQFYFCVTRVLFLCDKNRYLYAVVDFKDVINFLLKGRLAKYIE